MSELDAIQNSIRRHQRLGMALFIAVVGGLGGWAAAVDIAGAVIAPGAVVVDTSVKKIQHPTGGVIGQLNVEDGDKVKAGDILVSLDETITRANLAVLTKSIDELVSRRARLLAERDGESEIKIPEDLIQRAQDPNVVAAVEGEQRLFNMRKSAKDGQIEQLNARIAQLKEETLGARTQSEAKVKELHFITRELEASRSLWNKNLIPITKITQIEREATRTEGEHGQLLSAIAQIEGKIAETKLQIIQLDRDFGSDVAKELAETDAKIGELVERKVAAEDQLNRVDIRAPQSGIVHQLTVHTVGGVVSAGETIMMIVPEDDKLSVEARVSPNDINEIHGGQTARIRFSAFDQRTTPEIAGTLNIISPDVTTDPRTGATYYTVKISIPDIELKRLNGLKLVPGMPAEVFIQTESRQVLSYLVKPLKDQMMRSLREK
jgi:HlyD family secretion protein